MEYVLSTIIPFNTEDRKLIHSKEATYNNHKWKLVAKLLREQSGKATDIEVHIECASISGKPFNFCVRTTFNDASKSFFRGFVSSGSNQSGSIRLKVEELATTDRNEYFVSAVFDILPPNAVLTKPSVQSQQFLNKAAEEIPPVPQFSASRIESLEKEVTLLKQEKTACAERCLKLEEAVQKLDNRLQATDAKVALIEKSAEKAPATNPSDQKYTEAQLQSQISLLTAALTLSNERRIASEEVFRKLDNDKQNLNQTITVLEEQLAEMKIFKTKFSDYAESSGKCIADLQSYNNSLIDTLEAVKNEKIVIEEEKKKLQIENAELTLDVAKQNAILENTVLVYDVERKESKQKFVEMEANWKNQVDKLEKEIKEKDAKILDLTHCKDRAAANINGMQVPQQSAAPSVKNETPVVKAVAASPNVLVKPTPTSSSAASQQQPNQSGAQVGTTVPSTSNKPARPAPPSTSALANAQMAKTQQQSASAQNRAIQQAQQQAAQLLASTIIPNATATQNPKLKKQQAMFEKMYLRQNQLHRQLLLASLGIDPMTNNQEMKPVGQKQQSTEPSTSSKQVDELQK